MPAPRILEGPEAIAQAVAALSSGSVAAFPTETVYGLGADATDPEAVAKVFALKGRPSTNPLIVHCADAAMARTVTSNWPESADTLASAHWPGPLTLVLPKRDTVPESVTAGGPTVAVRCPDHPVALALIEAFGRPIVGPSANPSGRVSPTTAEHVAAGFTDDDLIIIDGGPCRAGIESTVLDLTSERPAVLRPGVIGAHELAQTLGIDIRPASPESHASPKSPGLLGAHYQPAAAVSLVGFAPAEVPPGTVVIAHSCPEAPGIIPIAPDLPGYAAGLYAALHKADDAGAAHIIVETPCPASNPAESNLRDAIMERLARASA